MRTEASKSHPCLRIHCRAQPDQAVRRLLASTKHANGCSLLLAITNPGYISTVFLSPFLQLHLTRCLGNGGISGNLEASSLCPSSAQNGHLPRSFATLMHESVSTLPVRGNQFGSDCLDQANQKKNSNVPPCYARTSPPLGNPLTSATWLG